MDSGFVQYLEKSFPHSDFGGIGDEVIVGIFFFPSPGVSETLNKTKQNKTKTLSTTFYTLSPQFTACFDTKVSQGNFQKYFQNQLGKHKPCRFLIPLRICLSCQNAFLLCD